MTNEFVARRGLISLGGITFPNISVNSTYTITDDDHTVDANGTFDITLPSAVGQLGKQYRIKNIGTGVITLKTTSSQLIDNLPSFTLAFYDAVLVESDGNGWVILNPQTKQYIRIYNSTGSIIPKGSACKIQSSFSGIPSVTLAIANGVGNQQVAGLAYIDIPNNAEGILISSGILSGLNLSGYTVGDILYLSDVVSGGYVSSTSSLQFSSRSNQIGFVTSNSSTIGTIQVSISNEDTNLTLTDIERNILEGNVISTGVYEFTGITQASSTQVNISNAKGWIVKNTYGNATLPDVTNVIYSGGTNITVTGISASDSTFFLLNSGSTITQQGTFPTPQQRRENILLGKAVHPNRTTIQNINNTVDFDVSPMAALRDLWVPLKLINLGVVVSPNGANMNINTSSGTLWGNGIGWTTNQLNPDSVYISGTTPTTFQYRTQTGGTFTNTTTIDATNYDLNGIVTALSGPGARSTNQRVYLFSTGVVRIQYGEQYYSNLTDAVTGLLIEPFIEYANNRDNGVLIGILSVRRDATNLSDPAQAIFHFVSKFGEISGGAAGGLSTTTLQQAYDNSSEPEIVTNSILGAVTLQRGSASDSDTVFEVQDGAGIHRMFVNASGRTTTTDLTITGVTSTSGLTRYLVVDISGNTYHQTGGDMILGSTQTNSGAKTFLNTTFLLRNVANTFNASFTNTNTADRVYTLPDAAGTIALTSNLSSYVPYTGATANVNIGANSYLGTKLQLGTPTGNTPSNFTVAIKNVGSDGLYMEGGGGSARILMQAQGLTGGNGQIELLANTNNNSYLKLGLTFLRESSGFLTVSATNFAPTSTLHVRGASASDTNNAFLVQNSTPSALFSVSNTGTTTVRGISNTVGNTFLVQNLTGTTLFSVTNAGLATFNPAGASGDAIEVTNGGYFKQANVRMRGSANSLLFYDVSYNAFLTLSPTQTLSAVPFVQSGYVMSNYGSGFGNAYYSMTNTYTNILGGYLHGIEVKNTYSPSSSTGIFRDLYIAPVISSGVTDWRGIEVVGSGTSVSTLIKLNNGTGDLFVVKGDSKIGFFGATPVVKQTLGVTTAGATYTSTEQGMLQRVYDAIRTYGLGT